MGSSFMSSPTTSSSSTGTVSTSSSAGLSTGAKAGIGIGAAAVGVALVAVLGWFVLRWRQSPNKRTPELPDSSVDQYGRPKVAQETAELQGAGRSELDASWRGHEVGGK